MIPEITVVYGRVGRTARPAQAEQIQQEYIIGFDGCLIPGITFVEQGENNSSKYVEFHFDDGECWTFTRQNSEDISEEDDDPSPEKVAHDEVYSAGMVSIPPECHPKPRTNI